MNLRFESTAPAAVTTDILGVIIDDPANLTDLAKQLDSAVGGAISRELSSGIMRKGSAASITITGAENTAKRIVLVGVSSKDTRSDALRIAGAKIAAAARAAEAKSIALHELNDHTEQQALVEGVVLGAFRTHKYGTEKGADDSRSRYEGPEEIVVLSTDSSNQAEGARTGFTIASAQNWARDLTNAPSNILPPVELAHAARELADQHEHLSFRELDRAEIEAQDMGMFAAVAQGSYDEPRLIVLEWNPPTAKQSESERLALVGKAVTFDTGGISIKPTSGMEGMKMDKGGGCAVLGAMRAIAELGVEYRVLAVVGSTTNMPDGNAYRPGDVVTAKDGTTVEIISTDAEGRLVLGDCISYARELGCAEILEASTLTGAMVIALGHRYTGAISKPDSPMIDDVLAAAKKTGDHAWHLPIHSEYTANLKTDCADFKNSGARDAGSLSAGGFLQHFAGDTPFVHLDVAGTGMVNKAREWYGCRGATGAGVRIMVELANTRAAAK